MKPLLPIVALMVVASSALKFTATTVKRHELHRRASFSASSPLNTTNQDGLNISSVFDLIYLADISVAGVDYLVQLDTGSSDLFITGATDPIPNTNETSLTLNLTYALGWAFGHIAYASVEFLNISVASQALVIANSVNNPAVGYGATGILGLGFTQLSSVDSLINNTHQSTGGNLLYNLFLHNPSEPNFIAFFLQRSTDPVEDDLQGSFSIGEYEPQFANASNNPRIPTWPEESPSRWNVLIDAVIVNNTILVPASTVIGAPSNKAVALIDSGASYSYVSKEVCDALYSNIPGARFDVSSGFWMLPCGAEVDVAFQIGEQLFPMHPMDVNPTVTANPSQCIGSFVPKSVLPGIDWLMGDNFIRSVYTVYGFGDFDTSGNMGNPYMQFLSLVDPDEGSVEFHQSRGGTPNTNITYTGLSAAALAVSSSLSDDTSQALGMVAKFILPMFALIALNSLILIICCIVWLVSFIRKRRGRGIARVPRSRTLALRSMPNSYIAEDTSSNASPSVPLHTYEPVSMAFSEDTFVPPSPAFYNSERKTRPKSFNSVE